MFGIPFQTFAQVVDDLESRDDWTGEARLPDGRDVCVYPDTGPATFMGKPAPEYGCTSFDVEYNPRTGWMASYGINRATGRVDLWMD